MPLAQGPLPDAVRQLLGHLAPDVGSDADVVSAVVEQCEQLGASSRR